MYKMRSSIATLSTAGSAAAAAAATTTAAEPKLMGHSDYSASVLMCVTLLTQHRAF
jgi:hypothetical protein